MIFSSNQYVIKTDFERMEAFIRKFFPDDPMCRRGGIATESTTMSTYSIKHFIEDFYEWQGCSMYVSQEDCERALRSCGIQVNSRTHMTNIRAAWLQTLRVIFPR